MSIFDNPTSPPYNVEVQVFGGVPYVSLPALLDIVERRGIMALRASGTPGVSERIADSERGRFTELQELRKLQNHVPK